MTKKFYITTAIPYVNAPPHIGHALEFVQADTVARYHRLLGEETCLLSGADENALKNVQAAEKEKTPIQEFIDKNAKKFQELAKKLSVKIDIFQRGSDKKNHFFSSQKLWRLCEAKGDIYQKKYKGLYCVGCETFYTPDELNEKGECFEHPGKKLEEVSEKNYFFKLSKYQKQLINIISKDELKIYPDFRKKEVFNFLKQPLLDISISRTNERARNWGVPVPDDDTQRIYVWFDADNIYQSGVGFGWNEKLYRKWWPADVHVIGKGIIRFHAIYWIAFLLSAGLSLPKSLFVHGYLTIEGQKMSKTLGNVIDPFALVNKYGTDAVRYYLLREIPPFDDGDYSESRMKELYNSDLANELGNLVSRLTTLAEKDEITVNNETVKQFNNLTIQQFNSFQFNLILEDIWNQIKRLNKEIDDFAPWKKSSEERKDFLLQCFKTLKSIAWQLQPFLPETAEKIIKATTGKIKKTPPLFPKL
ncbi:methionine--tRNA ligase [Candidatus Roizmanbacteria bacterium CG_4_10_14_0_8_um_filter_35_28]|uniref:Methionine--tRNA ligase n=3 Tax=Candidatus Roizmaniibacteriota TaxID=1752723 RepID=A0A2M8F1F3_9BACT|nr:MAG: methionine--tRNA ligase [Candidatus Roizmanbacteria bacterium CG23_combo_of_CG06-09_8_20_14_all_35_49]PIY71423.1 MAG: methionine--tRNA ligase [Candidatus Roizmanbacteria bacterium CG_4_10_14_0_8_um_filter_35_28]PJC33119.1 MAG: methionine--tRNA ligase [Candidatus Roizmanbacteria bacterium CG_4_9_14_0_2_um_filter_35_15]PJC82920.1 MAG: methionine--tRNA ligase [Candidatus Roizmanbacteria bacterium CG_4_8_14_3_um_filter_35_14]